MRTVRLFAAVAPAAALLLAPATVAAPYVPKDDATVLERLPLKPTDPLGRELRELRARLAAQPDDLDAAVTIGRHYFRLAMSEGDPRFIGYAEVALRPWSARRAAALDAESARRVLPRPRRDRPRGTTLQGGALARRERPVPARCLRRFPSRSRAPTGGCDTAQGLDPLRSAAAAARA